METRPRENSFFADFEKDSVRTRCVKNSFSIFLPSCFLGRVLRLSPGNTLITTSVFYQLIEQKLTKDWERFYKQAGLHDVFSAHVYRGHENKTGWQRKSLKNCHFFHNFSNSVNYQWEKPYFFSAYWVSFGQLSTAIRSKFSRWYKKAISLALFPVFLWMKAKLYRKIRPTR